MLKKWIVKWAERIKDREVYNEMFSNRKCAEAMPLTASSSGKLARNYEDENVINFRVYSASGGKIIETVRYDSKLSREKIALHVINDEDDFHSSLGKIITLEFMR